VRRERRTSDGRAPLQEGGQVGAPAAAGTPGTTLVSVIVVCWNAADVLGRCLDQLFAQDYANREIIVVDDGSDDDTLAVAEKAAGRGEVTLVRSPRNRGCPSARNLGLRHATGEIIAFIDADGFATPQWLGEIVRAFGDDPRIGGIASTVFFDDNPMVLNGAGGIVNRQGWAADLSMNESYESARIAEEALYPMGCGMALRRSALDRVGPFDDRMLNYYDDVDYGTRLWRAGYRVAVAADAWINHGFGGAGGDSAQKQLLCERHRIRVVLKHAAAGTLARWAVQEARALERAPAPRRALKIRATAWNLWHMPSVLASRWRLRRAPRVPDGLLDPSWGDGFPAGVPPLSIPRPETAASRIDMADPASGEQLLSGWFPVESVDGRSYRWAGKRAAALIGLDAPARRLRLDYAHVPVDIGGVDVSVRRLGSSDPLTPVWSTRLLWQYIARSVENHPLALPAGDYEVVFSTNEGWSKPPFDTRSLGFALASMSFEESFKIVPGGGLDMASAAVDEQLVSGWFEAEQSSGRSYRWAAGCAAIAAHLSERVGSAELSYRFPPGPVGAVTLSVLDLGSRQEVCSVRIEGEDTEWHEGRFPLQLAAGDYMIVFRADTIWSNPAQRDPALPPENRSLGFALSSLTFGAAA
jgi:GT2 family glycosyltransferase